MLEQLLGFAQEARLKPLERQLEQLTAEDSGYVPFADLLLPLIEQFQSEEIEDLLQQYLTVETRNAA